MKTQQRIERMKDWAETIQHVPLKTCVHIPGLISNGAQVKYCYKIQCAATWVRGALGREI